MTNIERTLLITAIILFIIVFYKWLMRFLHRKEIQGTFPYVFPFESKTLSGVEVLKIDLPAHSVVAPEISNQDGEVVLKLNERELSAGIHSIDMDLSNLQKGIYELKIRFSNQTSRIKIEIDNIKKAPR